MRFRLFIAIWFILPISLAFARDDGIYLRIDGDGRSHYSGRPAPGSVKVDIKSGYSYYHIKKVYDGDTVLLDDGRKVRLLGINAPEVEHRDRPGEAGGDEAKRWLAAKLANSEIRLETDAEQFDKYGRTLAHVFTAGNEHINVQLVEKGFAAVNIYPPNLLYAEQLIGAEQTAEVAGAGIWSKAQYAVLPARELAAAGHAGWVRVAGAVGEIRRSRKYVYLKISDRFEARIEKKWLPLFPDIGGYLGRTVEARGWLNKYKDGYSMLIRHPSALKVISP